MSDLIGTRYFNMAYDFVLIQNKLNKYITNQYPNNNCILLLFLPL